MITQDELARTAERLRDALNAAAEVMAEPDAAAKKVRSLAVAEIPPVSSQPAGNGTAAVIAQSPVRRTCS